MLHIDFMVEDLDAAVEYALSCGADVTICESCSLVTICESWWRAGDRGMLTFLSPSAGSRLANLNFTRSESVI